MAPLHSGTSHRDIQTELFINLEAPTAPLHLEQLLMTSSSSGLAFADCRVVRLRIVE